MIEVALFLIAALLFFLITEITKAAQIIAAALKETG